MSSMASNAPVSALAALLALGALGACAGGTAAGFRDLADIPERPGVTAREENERAAQSLMEDRARTAQAAEGLRDQPFDQPEPASPRQIHE